MSEKIKQDISIGKNLHRPAQAGGLSQEQGRGKAPGHGPPCQPGNHLPDGTGPLQYPGQRLIALKQIYGVSYEEFFQGLPDSR